MKFHKSKKFRESGKSYERRKTGGQKEKPVGVKERRRRRELSVSWSSRAPTLTKFMVSLEAPITSETLVMLGEKLSVEGTSRSAISLSSPAQSQYPTQQTHKHSICI